MKKIIKRKYNKETYTFYLNENLNHFTNEIEKSIVVRTPENSLGYVNTIMLHKKNDLEIKLELQNGAKEVNIYEAYATTRYIPKWILKQVEKKMLYLNDKIDTL